MSDFFTVKETQEGLAAICGSGKISKSLEKLILSAYHHVSCIEELEKRLERDIQALQDDVFEWQSKTFPYATIESRMAHLKKEADEVAIDKCDVVEYADCLMLLMGAAGVVGIAMDEILAAAWKKLSINKKRKWLPPDEHGVCYHDKATLGE